MDNKKRLKTAAYSVLLVAGLVLLDQITKKLAMQHLKNQTIWLIKDVFSLRYLENRGIGFGLLQGRIPFILIFNLLVLAVILFVLWRMPVSRRMTPVRIVLLFTVSGALGNIIDRMRLGYVVDFFSFDLINFPVFNVADIYVTVSVILLALLYLFYLKTDELEDALTRKKEHAKDSDTTSASASNGTTQKNSQNDL